MFLKYFICRPYAEIADVLSVNVGLELLEIVPGRVSTEVDAHLSYDTQKTVDKVWVTSWDSSPNVILQQMYGSCPGFWAMTVDLNGS